MPKQRGFGAAVGYGRHSVYKQPKQRGFGAAVGWGRPNLYGGPAAQSAPQAPAQPQPQALPPDPAFEAQQLANNRNLAVGNAYGALEHTNTTYDTGYNAAGQRDYSNPYNQAALLDESYKRSKLGTTNSYASSGQLHSGAYGRMQGENSRNYSIGSNELQTGAARAHQGTDLGSLQNIANYGTGNDQSAFDAILRALGVK